MSCTKREVELAHAYYFSCWDFDMCNEERIESIPRFEKPRFFSLLGKAEIFPRRWLVARWCWFCFGQWGCDLSWLLTGWYKKEFSSCVSFFFFGF